jgi:hypothetical protein
MTSNADAWQRDEKLSTLEHMRHRRGLVWIQLPEYEHSVLTVGGGPEPTHDTVTSYKVSCPKNDTTCHFHFSFN